MARRIGFPCTGHGPVCLALPDVPITACYERQSDVESSPDLAAVTCMRCKALLPEEMLTPRPHPLPRAYWCEACDTDYCSSQVALQHQDRTHHMVVVDAELHAEDPLRYPFLPPVNMEPGPSSLAYPN
uniref:Uncharacterized protein n=2 Tax=Myxococcus fulvus TaxID=33 RepID=B0YR27_MYXFU|nr:hypothetical protein pMF1.18 [Myxococcus fulvus]